MHDDRNICRQNFQWRIKVVTLMIIMYMLAQIRKAEGNVPKLAIREETYI